MQTESRVQKLTLSGAVHVAQSTEPRAMSLNPLNEYKALKMLGNTERCMTGRAVLELSVRIRFASL
jgi:hypothetical protein